MYKQYEPEVLKRLQQEELDVLKEFIRICNKYDIQYFAVFGTNIGANRRPVRHCRAGLSSEILQFRKQIL